MKRLILVVLMILLLTSCTLAPQKSENESAGKEYTIDDYFPYLEDTLLIYEGTENEYASQEIYFDFITEEITQLRVFNPGTTTGKLVTIKEGEIRIADIVKESFDYLEKLTTKKISEYVVLLKEPLEKGTSWTLADGKKRYISGVDIEVETPSGKYKAIEVTTELENAKQLDYYAAEIGHVKRDYQSENHNITTALKEIKQNTSTPYQIRFFYPDFLNEQLVYVDRKIEFSTNDDIKEIFTHQLRKTPGEDLNPVISENTTINEIKLDKKNKIVKVDFSKELVRNMNAGHLLESQIVQSIVNTFGKHYDVNKVYLSLEGRPYESGHMMLEEGETFTVTEDSKKYQND